MGFSQIKYVSLKPTLSADKVGFSLISLVYLRKSISSARADKVGLSAQADKDSFPNKPTLSACADDMGFLR